MKFVQPASYAGVILTIVLTGIKVQPAAGAQPNPLDKYNLSWTTPSKDSSGSMPLGNGDIGLNAWVEQDGDLLFYVSKTDAWSENAQLLKLGRIRVKLSPSPFRRARRSNKHCGFDRARSTFMLARVIRNSP
jgi:alpha-L-fucosidase 2